MNWTHGHLPPGKSERLFAWLASHPGRFHTWTLGFTHLVLIVGWDTKGKQKRRPFGAVDD